MRRLLLVPLIVLSLAACDQGANTGSTGTLTPLDATPDTNTPTDPPVTNATTTTMPDTGLDANVPWENYDESVRTRIAGLALAGDCDGLQVEFEAAFNNNDQQMERTGEGNTDLLTYIDNLLEIVGCY